MVFKIKVVYLHCQTTTTGRFSRTLLLGIWQIKNPKLKTADDLSDDLCLYCPLDDDEKGTHGVPNGYISCEGRCCQEAYEMYIEEWTE